MVQSRSKYEFYQEASLSQQLAHRDPIYTKLAGSDPTTSESIGFFEVLGAHGFIDLKDPNWKLVLDLLDMTRKARFATSEKVNEITKMGLQMPRGEDAFSGEDDEKNTR